MPSSLAIVFHISTIKAGAVIRPDRSIVSSPGRMYQCFRTTILKFLMQFHFYLSWQISVLIDIDSGC